MVSVPENASTSGPEPDRISSSVDMASVLELLIFERNVGLVPVALAPAILGLLGPLYGVSAAGLCGWFVFESVRVLRERTDAAARRMFRCSLAVLLGLFLAMLVDIAL